MSLEIKGRVLEVLEEQSGTGRNGPWRKQDFILETEGEYPNPVCVTQWGDNIEKFDVKPGETLTAHIDLRSREYNGRWYTDVKVWKVEKDVVAEGPGSPAAESPPLAVEDDPEADLPF